MYVLLWPIFRTQGVRVYCRSVHAGFSTWWVNSVSPLVPNCRSEGLITNIIIEPCNSGTLVIAHPQFLNCKNLQELQVMCCFNFIITKYSWRFCPEINKHKLLGRLFIILIMWHYLFPLTEAIKMTQIESVKMNWFPKVISVVGKCHAFIKVLHKTQK